MNAEHLVKRLAMIEKKSEVVWKCINKYYGEDFLLECIEGEYGVTNESSEKMLRHMEDHMMSLQQQYQFRLEDLKSAYL